FHFVVDTSTARFSSAVAIGSLSKCRWNESRTSVEVESAAFERNGLKYCVDERPCPLSPFKASKSCSPPQPLDGLRPLRDSSFSFPVAHRVSLFIDFACLLREKGKN
ncbi:unnamed protein product, partial [Scytosiphon promiscuus]